MKKKNYHMKTLMMYFLKNPTWDYSEKVAIAAELGMTYNQVSKWNWDQRKKCGITTDRHRKPI